MFLANFIFVFSHLKIHPKYFQSSGVIVVKKKYKKNFCLLITRKNIRSKFSFIYVTFKSLLPFVILMFVSCGAPGCTNRTDKSSNVIILIQ